MLFGSINKVCQNMSSFIDNCEYYDKLDCLLEKLNNEDWNNNPDDTLLKFAYDNKIIKNDAASFIELNKEDKKNLEEVLTLYYLKYEF